MEQIPHHRLPSFPDPQADEEPLSESFDLGSLTDEFRDEARDQVDRLDAGLLEIEREGALEEEARSGLLRTLHTLKGNAGMLGLAEIRDYVHVLENVLKTERDHWDEAAVERMFEGASSLRSAIEAAGTDAQVAAFRELGAARHRLEEVEADAIPEPAGMVEKGGLAPSSGTTGELLRVPFAKLDTLLNEAGELLAELDALRRAVVESDVDRSVRERVDSARLRGGRLQESVMSLRLVPIARVTSRFHGLVRRLAREQGKEARLVVEGEGTEVDKSTADALAEPLLHLVRNAVDHGIEPPGEREDAGKPRHGTVRITARQAGDRLRIEVQDDGAGLAMTAIRERARDAGLLDDGRPRSDREVADLIFRSGFSTRTAVSTVSGRGVGLDVVRRSLRALRADLSVDSSSSAGTRFVMRLPLTVAIVPVLVFRSAGEMMALPTSHIARTLRLDRVERVASIEAVRTEDQVVPLAVPGRLFGWADADRGPFGVVIRYGARAVAVTADELVDQRDLVVKALPRFGRRSPGVSGASVVPGGRVILVLDPAELIEMNVSRDDGGTR